MARRSAHRELNEWLGHHGYRHAQAGAQKTTPHPYLSRPGHATRKGTVAETLAAIRATGASVKRVDGEWQVNVPGGTERTTYFTDDGDDALASARAMMARVKPSHARMAAAPLDEITAELLRDASYGPGEYVARVAAAKPATDLQASPTLAAALEHLRRQPDRTMGRLSKALAYSKAMPSGKRDHANLIRLIKGGFVKVRKVNGPPPEGSTAWRDARHGDSYYELYLADEA